MSFSLGLISPQHSLKLNHPRLLPLLLTLEGESSEQGFLHPSKLLVTDEQLAGEDVE